LHESTSHILIWEIQQKQQWQMHCEKLSIKKEFFYSKEKISTMTQIASKCKN